MRGFTLFAVPAMRVALGSALALCMLALCGACGSAGSGVQPATHDDFRAIQRHEATIDARLPEATADGVDCDTRTDAAQAVCAAAEGICRIAEDTADLDARDRCRSARDACRGAEAAGPGCQDP